MTGNYNLWIVTLSVVIAIIASYSALGLAARVSASNERAAKFWLAGGAFSMGVGIWSMHFIGMLAFHFHIPISYDVPLTLASMAASIVSSWLALFVIRRGAQDVKTYAVSGLLMGAGISVMHYTGMAAMKMSPPIHYDPTLFVVSVLIAIVASMAALWMAFRLESAKSAAWRVWQKLGSAIAMGLAISGMHYTGMAAARFGRGSVCLATPRGIDSLWLVLFITIGSLAIIFLTLQLSIFDARLAEQQTVAKLLHTEEQFRLISENVTDLIAVVDLNGRRVYNSPSYKGIVRNPDALRGTLSFNEVHPEDRERIKAIFQETIRTGQGQRAEYRFLLEDNTTRLIESQGSLIRNQQGEPVNLVIVSRDITQRKSLEEQLRQSQKMEAIGQLAGGVAHDFNNLLTIISGYSELVADAVGPEGPVCEQVQEIQKAAKRAAALTRQLLAFSRRQIMTLEVLDLKIVIAHLEKMLQRLIGENVELVTLCVQEVGHVKADQGQIEQVLMNLVVNARDAMAGGGKITIEITNVDVDQAEVHRHPGLKPGRHVMLAVSDTGCGMGAEVLAHMFEPFFTTKEKGKGTGLALATVYGIVKQSGGYIAVESEIGRGSSFKIYLPLIEEHVIEPEVKFPLAAHRSCTEAVLVVEDEEAVRSLVRRLLETSGYTVLEASRGAEALALCERHAGPIHLMLTDVVMPLMSGIELAEQLASLLPATKIIYMSGYTNNTIARRGVADEDIEFLAKPFTPQQLENKVRAVLDAASTDQSKAA